MPFDPHVLWGLGKSRPPSTNTQAGQAVSRMSVYFVHRALPLHRIQFIRPGCPTVLVNSDSNSLIRRDADPFCSPPSQSPASLPAYLHLALYSILVDGPWPSF